MKIDKDIPIPDTKRASKPLTATFAVMEIGDSIVATGSQLNNARQWFRKNDRKMTSIKLGHDQYRVWRTE